MQIERLNWSTLKYIATSPKLMKWRAEQPLPDTSAMRLGRAIHCAVLEPDQYKSRWLTAGTCVAPKKSGDVCGAVGSLIYDAEWFCKIRGHAPDGATGAPEGCEVLSIGVSELVSNVADAIMSDPDANDVLRGGKAECNLEWTDPDSGIACRGRIDYLRPNGIVDIKTTSKATIREFVMDAARNMYHGQITWYHDGAIHAGRLPVDAEMPTIVMAQTIEPYDVAVIDLSAVDYGAGQCLRYDLMNRYADCLAANNWPGIAPDRLTLNLPDWAPGMNGTEEDF